MKIEPVAERGEVVLYDEDEHVKARLSRDEAIEMLPGLVAAIHKAGDLSDPFAVALGLAIAGVMKARDIL